MSRLIIGVRPMSAALATTDLVLIRLWVRGELSTPETLAAHVAATAIAVVITLALWRRGRVQAVGSLLICLLLGPIGGLALLIADLGRGTTRPLVARSKPLTAPPSRAERLHAEIVQGRRRHARTEPPQPFAEVFASGALARQQEAIAAISLHYRPEMLPALRLALASEKPALRVQAAAVYAKLRGSFGERAKAVCSAAVAKRFSLELAVEAETVAASGFVDQSTVAELKAHAVRAAAMARLATSGRRPDALDLPSRLGHRSRRGVA